MIQYSFKDDKVLAIKNSEKADAQKIGEALAKITAQHEGHLRPHDVVHAARDRKSTLHPFFEWDDALAAESFRVEQARSLVQSIHVVDKATSKTPIRAFVSIQDDGPRSYRTISEVLGSKDLRDRLLEAAERDLRSFEIRFRELTDVCRIVRQAREKVNARRQKAGQDNRATA